MVAGTCVLGSQFILVRGDMRVATWLWYLGIGLWLVLIYAVFTLLTVKGEKPALPDGINGGWSVGRRHAFGRGPRESARPVGHERRPRADRVLLPGDVARREHALRLDHRTHLLPLHLLPNHAGEPGGPLLD